MNKIVKYVMADILRNRIVVAYTVLLLVISLSVFFLEDNASKGLLSLLNVVLIVVPLVSVIFSAIYVYNSAEFLELLVSRPVKRVSIWISLFIGLSCALTLAFFAGVGIPLLIFAAGSTGIIMMVMGVLLSVIFVAIAMLVVVSVRDKAKGIGVVILLWLYFSLIFDGLVIFLMFQFADYPLEKAVLFVSGLNPIDIARILILLKMDESVMMGFTGAVFKDIIGTTGGMITTFFIMLLWIAIPLLISLKKFNKKDL